MIDADGFRPNVGIILTNGAGKLFWARRVTRTGWQFPQGGINASESAEDALYRELAEEVGLLPEHVEQLAVTREWVYYRLPRRYQRRGSKPLCIGQKQRWFLLRMLDCEDQVCFDSTSTPEFDDWRWVDYWHPLEDVIYFKREVYTRVLEEFAPVVFPEGVPAKPQQRERRGQRRASYLRRRRN